MNQKDTSSIVIIRSIAPISQHKYIHTFFFKFNPYHAESSPTPNAAATQQFDQPPLLFAKQHTTMPVEGLAESSRLPSLKG